QSDRPDHPGESLRTILSQICAARGLKSADKRIKFIPIKGLADPTDHEKVIHAVEQWLAHDDPFDLGRRHTAKQPTRIGVNLGPGRPPRPAAGRRRGWTGGVGGAESVVEFVRGDGGLSERVAENPPPNPLRTVPIDVLSQFIGRAGGTAPQPTAGPEEPGVPLE